jgi:hypothetical protein
MRIGLALLMACVLATASCGGKAPKFTQSEIAGNWQLSLTPTGGGATRTGGGLLGQIDQVGLGGTLRGGMILSGACAGKGTVTGVVDRQDVTIDFGQTGQSVALTGIVSSDNTSISGTYITTVTTCGVSEMGTFTATAVQALNGAFTATLTSTQGGGITMATGMISQSVDPTGGTLAVLTGKITATTSACLPADGNGDLPTFTGSISGGTVVGLTVSAADGSGALGNINGTSGLDGKSINAGNYTFTSLGGGSVCDTGTAAVTLP